MANGKQYRARCHIENILYRWPLFKYGIRFPWQRNAYQNYLAFKEIADGKR